MINQSKKEIHVDNKWLYWIFFFTFSDLWYIVWLLHNLMMDNCISFFSLSLSCSVLFCFVHVQISIQIIQTKAKDLAFSHRTRTQWSEKIKFLDKNLKKKNLVLFFPYPNHIVPYTMYWIKITVKICLVWHTHTHKQLAIVCNIVSFLSLSFSHFLVISS